MKFPHEWSWCRAPKVLALSFTHLLFHVLIEAWRTEILSYMDETSLSNIFKAIQMEPLIVFALCEGEAIFWSRVLSQAWNLR